MSGLASNKTESVSLSLEPLNLTDPMDLMKREAMAREVA